MKNTYEYVCILAFSNRRFRIPNRRFRIVRFQIVAILNLRFEKRNDFIQNRVFICEIQYLRARGASRDSERGRHNIFSQSWVFAIVFYNGFCNRRSYFVLTGGLWSKCDPGLRFKIWLRFQITRSNCWYLQCFWSRFNCALYFTMKCGTMQYSVVICNTLAPLLRFLLFFPMSPEQLWTYSCVFQWFVTLFSLRPEASGAHSPLT